MPKKMKIVVGIIIITTVFVIGKIILENKTIALEGTISGIDYKISNNNEYENKH